MRFAAAASGDDDDLAVADITMGPTGPRSPSGDGFWIPAMRDEYLVAWESENRLGEERYPANRDAMLRGGLR